MNSILPNVAAVALLAAASGIALAEPSANVVFADSATKQGNRVDPGNVRESFGCDEEIFGIVSVEGLSPGSHDLEARWRSPNGEVVKSDAGTIEIPNQQQVAYLSTSIAVQRSGDGTDEASPFQGQWSIEVVADGISVGNGTVEVNC